MGPLRMGFTYVSLLIIRDQPYSLRNMLQGFKNNYVAVVLAPLLTALLVMVGFIVFILPRHLFYDTAYLRELFGDGQEHERCGRRERKLAHVQRSIMGHFAYDDLVSVHLCTGSLMFINRHFSSVCGHCIGLYSTVYATFIKQRGHL